MSIDASSPYDSLSKEYLEKLVLKFVSSKNKKHWDRVILDQYINSINPRSIFVRNLLENAKLLDLGAGDGGLSILKSWPIVTRPDIKMYAVSLDEGNLFLQYEDYQLCNFEETLPSFGDTLFDAIVCSHFIEHISNPYRAIQYFSNQLKAGGSLYLEWPHPISRKMPPLTVLRDIGVNVMTINFYDDLTHKEAWEMDIIASALMKESFSINTFGRVWLNFVADELMAHGKDLNNNVDMTYSVWYKFAWAQYIIASKPL